MTRRRCSEQLSNGVRKLLLAALTVFARGHGIEKELDAVIELYERGFLRIGCDDDNGLYVEMCTPEDAPQLRTDVAFETGRIS
jgi:hypothetical protein